MAKAPPGRPAGGAIRSRYLKADANKEALYHAIEAGSTVKEACALTGISYSSWSYYRQSDAKFRARIDQLRVYRNVEENGGWTGNFASFRDTFLKHEFPTPAFHIDIINRLETAPGMSVSLVLVPPNFGKTSVLEDWVNYKLATDPNHRVTIVSKSQGQARKSLGKIQRRMTDVHIAANYIARFGPFVDDKRGPGSKPWTADAFTVLKSDHDERDFSLQALGWTGQVYGSRVDTLILDDIQTHDNLNQIDKMLDKFHGEFVNRIGGDGRIFIIGTRIESGDIYEKLIDADIIDRGRVMIRPAINHEGESLWPDRWPLEKLEKMRRISTEKAWWTAYQQQPQLAGNATFTEEMVDDAKDAERSIGTGPDGKRQHNLPVVLGLDPALGGGNAICAIAYDNTKMYLLDTQKDVNLARTEDILQRIEEFAIRYKPNHLIVEVNAFQRSLARDERLEALSKRYGFRVHEHSTNRNKLDPVLGVGSMAGTFLRGEFSIPWADDIAKARMEPFCAELRAWRPHIATKLLTQDFVMCTWFAWLFVLSQRRFMGASPSHWRRKGIPYRPMTYNGSR